MEVYFHCRECWCGLVLEQSAYGRAETKSDIGKAGKPHKIACCTVIKNGVFDYL